MYIKTGLALIGVRNKHEGQKWSLLSKVLLTHAFSLKMIDLYRYCYFLTRNLFIFLARIERYKVTEKLRILVKMWLRFGSKNTSVTTVIMVVICDYDNVTVGITSSG